MLSQDSVFSQEKQTGKLVIHACNGWQSHGVNKCEEVTSSVLVDNVQTTLFVCFGCRSKGETHFGRDAFRSSRVVRVRQITEADCSIDFPSDVSHKVNESIGVTLPFAQQVCGINIGVVSHETTRHPEYLFQLAQSGCDVCVIFGKGNGHVDDVLYNCVHRMIVVFNDDGKIHVAIPPNGHETWREEISHETGFCTAVVPLDTVRSKEWLQKVAHCLQLIPETAEA
jgi:hypothetical protein